MTASVRPPPGEYDPYYEGYISRVPDGPILETMAAQSEGFRSLMAGLSRDAADYRYAPGKWTVEQLIGHVNDAERVFGMRAMCIARGETAELPGYDQDEYVAGTSVGLRSMDSLVREFEFLRAANLEMFSGLSPDDWLREGRANESGVTVRALAWVMAGHVGHHMSILRERYREAF